jgi:hypothetical protein
VSKKVKIIVISVVCVLLAAVMTLIVIEQVGKRKVKIVNNTDRNITKLQVMFETEEESTVICSLFDGELQSGRSYSGTFETQDFSSVPADLGMLVTFEGEEEIFVYDGYFDSRFDGSVDIEFFQAEGQYRAMLSATSGLFRNSDNTYMKDDEIFFDFENADWDMVDFWGDEEDMEEMDDFDIVEE